MSIWKKSRITALAVLLCSPAIAQQNADELDAKMREAEQRLVGQEADLVEYVRQREIHLVEREAMREEALHEMHRVRAELDRVMRDENIEVEIRIREAEASMVEAAQHMAQLSSRQLPRVALIERIIRGGYRPVLGIQIGTNGSEEPVAGATIRAISPGGAAEESGLRAGDVITSINDESLTADNNSEANEILLDFMQGVEEDDELTIEYLRNGKSLTVDVEPRPVGGGVFEFKFDGRDFTAPDVHFMPGIPDFDHHILWTSRGSGLGDMEIVPLTERLGRYFGTDEGLLIVRAPENKELKLQDGDVIRSIDGRKPKTVNHAMRILGSYESGETVNIEIMRDKRKQTISFEVPDNRSSALAPVAPVVPHEAPHVLFVPKVLAAPHPVDAPEAAVVILPAERI